MDSYGIVELQNQCHQQNGSCYVIKNLLEFHICLLFSSVLVLVLALGGGHLVPGSITTRLSRASLWSSSKAQFEKLFIHSFGLS